MSLTSVRGLRVGHGEVPGGKSGCTVVLGPFRGAVEVLGLATGTRELDVLSGTHLVGQANALVFSGGSAFGLSTADGVMAWLAEQGEGFETGVAPVPIVPAAVLFDLAHDVPRPGPAEGRRACEIASSDPVQEGRVGAGAGATVGKLFGAEHASPGGVGTSSVRWRGGTVGALAVVNALGDVVGPHGQVLAGARIENGPLKPEPGTHTTLALVATDLPLSRVDLGRLCRMAATAFPRAISPVCTPFDGDVVFALSTGGPGQTMDPSELLSLGVIARDLTEEAIRRGVTWPGHLSQARERFAL